MVTQLEKNLAQRYTVSDMFRRNARHAPLKTALIEPRGDARIRLNYKELNDRINQFAAGLKSLGYKPKDRVAILGLNSHEFIISLFGCARGGFVAVPLNPGMAPDDLVYMINHSESKVIIAEDVFTILVDQIKADCPGLGTFVSLPVNGGDPPDYFLDFNTLLNPQPTAEIEEIIWERDTFGIYYTSGTTSRPKGTLISHLSVVMMTMTNMIEFGITKNLSTAMVLPAFHIAQNTLNMSTFMSEGQTIVYRAFDPGVILKDIQTEKIQMLLLLPIMWAFLVDDPQLKEYDTSSLSSCLFGMAPMDKKTLEKLIEAFTDNVIMTTGQTEFVPATENFKKEWQLKKTGNYWGEPAVTVETAIMDEDGNFLPQGEIGEIVRRGPGTLQEYLGNPEATAEKLKFGWAHSEDIGYFDEDNLLVFIDRTKDMIKTGGENVPSSKVEQAIMTHPKVAETAVVGLPHERWSEAITAFVVPLPGGEISEDEIISHCKELLGGFEVPKRVMVVNELPKTMTGKIRKNIIKDENTNLYA